MKKNVKLKYILILLIAVLIVLFHNNNVLADAEVSDIKFKFTYYSDARTNYNSLGAGYTYKDFTVNEKYGWYEYEKDGTNYVVMAGATNELLNTGFASKQNHIHYFNYNDVFQFKFEDQDFDDNIYYGIILDSCGESMGVADDGSPQILDVYVKDSHSGYESINQKIVLLTEDGSFKEKAGKKKSSGLDLAETFTKMLNGFGDMVQSLLEYKNEDDNTDLEMGPNPDPEVYSNKDSDEITRKRSDIEEDKELNKMIQVSDFDSDIETDTLYTVTLSNEFDNKYGKKEERYTADTEIPIMSVDIYSMATNPEELLDVDFFDTSNKNSNEGWNVIRKIISNMSHISMYISVALIITIIIWRAIILLRSTLGDNPTGARESKEIINGVVRAVILLSLIYAIMTLIMYIYNKVVKLVIYDMESSYIIRVVVENLYSFNTTIIGYIRYLSLAPKAVGYAFLYALMQFISLIWYGFMFVRMLFIGLLAIIAPIVAVNTMTDNIVGRNISIGNILNFNQWLRTYLIWLWVPLVMAIIIRILLLL